MRSIIRPRLRRLGMPALATFALAAAVPSGASAASPCAAGDRHAAELGAPALRASTLCLVNRERHAHGLASLRSDERLATAARRHSRDMVAKGYFSHDSRSGASFRDRIARTGWMKHRRSWSVGENLAWGAGSLSTPRSIVSAWMKSPGHRRNVLDRDFRVVGIGVAPGAPVSRAPGAATVTADFGS